jgi:hypothetical protein
MSGRRTSDSGQGTDVNTVLILADKRIMRAERQMNRVVTLWILWTCAVILLASTQPAVPAKVVAHRPGLAFVRFVDPRESAFSAEVPQGWKSSGGLFRFASVDTRGALESSSPEGDIRVSWGDADVPSFTVPNQMLAMAGFSEGSWYSPGYGVRMLVRRYQPGATFAEDYVRTKLARQIGCSGLTINGRAPRADLTQSINALYAQFGAMGQSVREDAGEVSFDCTRNGQPWKGYYLVTTLIASTGSGAIWHAEHVLGYAAAADRVGLARAAMLRLAGSIQLNPEWVRVQDAVTMATSRIVTKTNEHISATIRKTFENKWKTEDEIFRRDANARRGLTNVLDTETGESWTVQNGSRYYWRKSGSDAILGTQTYDPPGFGYEPLREY